MSSSHKDHYLVKINKYRSLNNADNKENMEVQGLTYLFWDSFYIQNAGITFFGNTQHLVNML